MIHLTMVVLSAIVLPPCAAAEVPSRFPDAPGGIPFTEIKVEEPPPTSLQPSSYVLQPNLSSWQPQGDMSILGTNQPVAPLKLLNNVGKSKDRQTELSSSLWLQDKALLLEVKEALAPIKLSSSISLGKIKGKLAKLSSLQPRGNSLPEAAKLVPSLAKSQDKLPLVTAKDSGLHSIPLQPQGKGSFPDSKDIRLHNTKMVQRLFHQWSKSTATDGFPLPAHPQAKMRQLYHLGITRSDLLELGYNKTDIRPFHGSVKDGKSDTLFKHGNMFSKSNAADIHLYIKKPIAGFVYDNDTSSFISSVKGKKYDSQNCDMIRRKFDFRHVKSIVRKKSLGGNIAYEDNAGIRNNRKLRSVKFSEEDMAVTNKRKRLGRVIVVSEDNSSVMNSHGTSDSHSLFMTSGNRKRDLRSSRFSEDSTIYVNKRKRSVGKTAPFSKDATAVANNSSSSGEDSKSTVVQIPRAGSPKSSGFRNSTKRGVKKRRRRRRGRRRHHLGKDLSLWIDERQVKLFSGYIMEIFVIHDGRVLPYVLDPNFEKHLPVIPYEVQSVNFTWQAGKKRYHYTFDRLFSHDPLVLKPPVVSLPLQGRIPRRPKVFSVNIHCTGNASGIASFDIGLLIQSRRGKPMPGTPLRLKLRKECTQPSAYPECDEKCENGGVCDAGQKCQCPEGYMGPYCNTALCYPQCMNGGTCTTPGRCTCPPGYQGRHCEGGICREKCENGGKCIQKDTCSCPRGYYGNRCEFSKCVIPCINGGKCKNVNKCRCPRGFAGDHCEIVTGNSLGPMAITRCTRKCRRGTCKGATCVCQEGFTGRWCRRRGAPRERVWM